MGNRRNNFPPAKCTIEMRSNWWTYRNETRRL